MKTDVLIIGGGVIGSSAAYELSKAGKKVALLERHDIGSGASGMSAAGLEAQLDVREGDASFSNLLIESRALFPELAKELAAIGIDIGFEPCGILRLAKNEEESLKLKKRMDWQAGCGWRVEWFGENELKGRCPGLKGYGEGLFYADDGQILASRFTSGLAEAARRRGCSVQEHCEVLSIHSSASSVQVKTQKGSWDAGQVIIAAGPWADQLLSPLGMALHLEPVRGQLLLLDMPKRLLPFMIYTAQGYLVPKADGTLIIGTTQERVGFSTATTETAVHSLKKFALATVPELARCRFIGAVAGLRPGGLPGDIPAIGPLPGIDNVFVAAGHFKNGMLLAPITAKMLAAQLLDQKPPLPLEPFLPSRLFNRSAVR
jgi:glycine oxidase